MDSSGQLSKPPTTVRLEGTIVQTSDHGKMKKNSTYLHKSVRIILVAGSKRSHFHIDELLRCDMKEWPPCLLLRASEGWRKRISKVLGLPSRKARRARNSRLASMMKASSSKQFTSRSLVKKRRRPIRHIRAGATVMIITALLLEITARNYGISEGRKKERTREENRRECGTRAGGDGTRWLRVFPTWPSLCVVINGNLKQRELTISFFISLPASPSLLGRRLGPRVHQEHALRARAMIQR